MIRELDIGGIKWIDAVGLKPAEVEKVLEEYKIHELDLEACLEGNQKARIDTYNDYSFLIFHFPIYNSQRKLYELNEFNIFLWKDTLITFRDSSGNHINKIFNYYDELNVNVNKRDIKVSAGYILYEITQAMLEKMFKVTANITIDIKKLENQVFDGNETNMLVKDIMIKKRNIITLKHMFKPQVVVLKKLELTINNLYAGKMEVYFEDLENKLEQIVNEISVLQEYIESTEDAFKSMVDIKTNFVIKVLTVFSTFMLPLTFITSFYGMNVELPYSENYLFILILLFFSLFIMFTIYIYLKKRGRF